VSGGILKRQHHILRAIFNRVSRTILEDCMENFGAKIVKIKKTLFWKNFSH
jgi:hypothetical protein